jgi:cathepsin A (carboxypeptidase C)
MAENLPRCIEVASVCYSHPEPVIYLVAEEVCWYDMVQWYDGESGKGRRNRFNITAPYDIENFYYKLEVGTHGRRELGEVSRP